MTFLRDALDLAHKGFHVFPLAVRGKIPMIQSPHPKGSPERESCKGECGLDGHGFYDATTDDRKIQEWWTRWPEANIGARTGAASGFDVFDIDGDDGKASLDGLEEKFGRIPPTRAAVTGRGLHFYFKHHDGMRCHAGIFKGIDIKGDDGYVVVPPSVHESGRAYAWILR